LFTNGRYKLVFFYMHTNWPLWPHLLICRKIKMKFTSKPSHRANLCTSLNKINYVAKCSRPSTNYMSHWKCFHTKIHEAFGIKAFSDHSKILVYNIIRHCWIWTLGLVMLTRVGRCWIWFDFQVQNFDPNKVLPGIVHLLPFIM
jgi:hypothetical protein